MRVQGGRKGCRPFFYTCMWLLVIWTSGQEKLLAIWTMDIPTSGLLDIWTSGLLSRCPKNVLIGTF